MSRGLSRAQLETWLSYLRGSQLLERAVVAQLRRDADLTHADYALLAQLSGAPGRRLRMGLLAQRTVAPSSRLTYQVDRLAARGLLAREATPGDGRGTEAVLTDAGQALLDEAAPGHVATVRQHLVGVLTADEMAALGVIMRKIAAHLEP